MLRLAGWRFSATREAWVHRMGDGRMGPVFCIEPVSTEDLAREDTRLFEAMVARRQPTIVPEADRVPLPRRVDESRAANVVEVSLGAAEPPRLVQVDGRPPRRGVDPQHLRATTVDRPLRASRATA